MDNGIQITPTHLGWVYITKDTGDSIWVHCAHIIGIEPATVWREEGAVPGTLIRVSTYSPIELHTREDVNSIIKRITETMASYEAFRNTVRTNFNQPKPGNIHLIQ